MKVMLDFNNLYHNYTFKIRTKIISKSYTLWLCVAACICVLLQLNLHKKSRTCCIVQGEFLYWTVLMNREQLTH